MKLKYFKQETKYTCGAAAMRMVLGSLGIEKSEKEVVKLLKTNKIRGTWARSFPLVAEKLKLNYIAKSNSSFKELKEALSKKYKILLSYYIPEDKVDHYAVVREIRGNKIILADHFYGDNYTISLRTFIRNWRSDFRWENKRRWFFGVKK